MVVAVADSQELPANDVSWQDRSTHSTVKGMMVDGDRKAKSLRALIVDHEWGVRTLLSKALVAEGFTCDVAPTVDDALALIAKETYELVVTDVIMPDKLGHSLVVELLAMPERPLVCVLTAVTEPRIAKDLMARGVDDLVFKPAPIPMFAAKMHSLVDRRLRLKEQHPEVAAETGPARRPGHGLLGLQVSQEELAARLRVRQRIPAVSEAAIAVHRMTTDGKTSSQQIAAAVQREPALIAEVLRLANSSFFNPSTQKITEIEQAVVRLGQKRVGELALSTAAFAAVSQQRLPFFSLSDIWRKCLAAGICLEMLLSPPQGDENGSGLFCTAVLQPMGRILLAGAFPDIYERLIQHCHAEKKTLIELENQVFPQRVGEIAASILASWGLPESIHRPLRYTDLPFAALNSVSGPLRRRVEMIKIACVLGELVVGEFDAWDLVDVPPGSLLERLEIQTVDETILQCRDDLRQIASFGIGQTKTAGKKQDKRNAAVMPVAYQRVLDDGIDFIPHLISATGRRATALPEVPPGSPLVVNALNAAAHQAVSCLRDHAPETTTIFTDAENAELLRAFGHVIIVPGSYEQLAEALDSAGKAGAVTPAKTATGHSPATTPSVTNA